MRGEKFMRRILVPIRESPNKFSLREVRGIQADINSRIKNFWRRRCLREEGASAVDLQALNDVQTQLDVLVEQLVQAKIMLAGFAIGAKEVFVDDYHSHSSEEYEVSG